MRPGGEKRGNSYDRRRRREWLWETHKEPGGYVRCFHCKKAMRNTWEVDRYPLCGHQGGTYRRDNIVISCRKCNGGRCNTCPKEARICGFGKGELWNRRATDQSNQDPSNESDSMEEASTLPMSDTCESSPSF